jgi:hypothetical protein
MKILGAIMDKLELGIELYKNGLPLLRAAKEAGVGINRLNRTLKNHGLMRSNKVNSRKYSLNHSFFEQINNEETAYWLGFLYADGYITQSKYAKYVGLSLGYKDEPHLLKFQHAIQATYPIGHYETTSWGVKVQYSRLLLTSDKMFDDLTNKGAIERKSLVLSFPHNSIVPANLRHHFIRGYFDGDGSFSKSPTSIYAFRLCGTEQFLRTLSEYIGHSNVPLYKRHKNEKNTWHIDIGGRVQVKAIGDFMYKDSKVFLDRKYHRYQELVSHDQSPHDCQH